MKKYIEVEQAKSYVTGVIRGLKIAIETIEPNCEYVLGLDEIVNELKNIVNEIEIGA